MDGKNTILQVDCTASTNDMAKELARRGAAHGTAVLAKRQTAGRGRLGRTFLSPEGGLYLSVILRPERTWEALQPLTALLAVAACDAVEKCCGIRPRTKWVNDLVLQNRKLAGILTEPCFRPNGVAEFVVCGIGMNLRTPEGGFHPEIRGKAVALDEILGKETPLLPLAEAVTDAFCGVFSRPVPETMAQYRKDCVTLGKTVKLLQAEGDTLAFAETVLDDGALLVRYEDGTERAVFSGEAAVRGLYDYL